MESQMVFTESQRFTQWWLYIIVGLAFIVVLAAVIFLFMGRLETRIDREGVHCRYFPLQREKHIAWSDISKAYVRKYQALSEYGGWGIKGIKSNKAWNVSGNMGLQLELKNGKKLLIGTQKAEQIEQALKAFLKP